MKYITQHPIKKSDLGFHGNLFGGIMLSWLDEAGGAYASQACDTPRMVTVKMSETVFRKPVRPGHIIKIYGEIIRVGNSSCTVRLEARRHSVYNGSQKTVCETEITYVRIDGDGEAIPLTGKVKGKYKSVSKDND